MKGIVPTFHVTDIDSVVELLALKGLDFGKGITRSQIGAVAKFEAPTGHTFYLYQPSEAALRWTNGMKIKEILNTQL